LHVLALVKQVPRHDAAIRFDSSGHLVRDGAPTDINPFCRRAIAHAVRLAAQTGGTSTALTMGPPQAADALREALACGIDQALLLSDPVLAGADCLATARALGSAVRQLPGTPDLIVVGRSSVDADTGAVGPMLAEMLGLPFAGPASELEVAVTRDRALVRAALQHDDAEEHVELSCPAVVAVAERSIHPAKAAPALWAPRERVQLWTGSDLRTKVRGVAGSGTQVRAVRAATSRRAGIQLAGDLTEQVRRAVDRLLALGSFMPGTHQAHEEHLPPSRPRTGPVILCLLGADQAGQRGLLGEAAILAERVGGHVRAIAQPHSAEPALLARWGADAVLVIDGADPAPLAAALAVSARTAWAVLAPATAWGREVLSRLAVRVPAGLIADAVALDLTSTAAGKPRLIGVKPAGGGAVAEIVCITPVQLATVRTGCLPARTPRAGVCGPTGILRVPSDRSISRLGRTVVDTEDSLDRARTVIGLGRGVPVQEYAALEPLRQGLCAEFAGTRPVTDAGWLPHGRQLGITARSIAPQLYIALGISGSANHLAGVHRAHSVLAVNADPDAPIFTSSDVGVVGDWRTTVELLCLELRRRQIMP
jgi:electron transfer flavoprotein alpha subunit